MGEARGSRWLLCIPLLFAICALPYAFGASHGERTIPASLRGRQVHPTIVQLNYEDDVVCPSGIFEHLHSNASIAEIARKIDLNPQCIWKTIRRNAAKKGEIIRGFAFGTVSEISMTGGIGVATELVIMKYDDQTLMIGQIYSESGLVAVGLPGVSLTQSVVFGNCPEALFSYLGWFDTVSALAMSKSYGKADYNLPGIGRYSGCNALTSTRGSTAPVLGASQSYYHQEAPFVLVRGPRAAPLLNFLAELNRGK